MFLEECFNKTDSVSLYIHIPFCFSKCAYCGFYSISESKTNKECKALYFKKLIDELKTCVSYFEKPFKTIYIGGGTPLLKDQIADIREILSLATKKGEEEVTIECNINNYTEDVHSLIGGYITRISAGIQSFDKDTLKVLGRRETTINDVVNFLKIAKDKIVNLDFIAGVPSYLYENQSMRKNTADDLKELFQATVQNNVKTPEHLSVYLLSIEDGTNLKKKSDNILKRISNRSVILDDEDEREAIELKNVWQYLESKGYKHYEVSAFAHSGNECKHNKMYWGLENYIGLGCTASSHSKKGYDITSPSTYEEYALSRPWNTYKIEKCSTIDIALELLLTSLRTTDGLERKKFDSLTGLSLNEIVSRAEKKCPSSHNVMNYYKNGVLALTGDELLFSDFYINLLSEIVLNYNLM